MENKPYIDHEFRAALNEMSPDGWEIREERAIGSGLVDTVVICTPIENLKLMRKIRGMLGRSWRSMDMEIKLKWEKLVHAPKA